MKALTQEQIEQAQELGYCDHERMSKDAAARVVSGC